MFALQPEPLEFLKDRQQKVAQRVASTAASRVASSFIRQHSALASSDSTPNTAHSFLRSWSSLKAGQHAGSVPSASKDAPSAAQQIGVNGAGVSDVEARGQRDAAPSSKSSTAAPPARRHLSARQLSLQLQRSVSITADGRVVRDEALSARQLLDQQRQSELESLGCEQEFQEEVRLCCGCHGCWIRKRGSRTCTRDGTRAQLDECTAISAPLQHPSSLLRGAV